MSISEKKINQDSAKCCKDQEAMGKESEKLEAYQYYLQCIIKLLLSRYFLRMYGHQSH